MAVDAPLITRQRVFAAKAETTTGTAISLSASDAEYNAFDPLYSPDIPANDRRGQSAFSRLPQVPGARMAEITLGSELHGTGTSGSYPQWATALLLAAGFSQSGGTFTPVTGSSSATTLTAAVYQDGLKYSAAGCVANCAMNFTSGNPVQVEWTLRGVHQAPTDTAILAPDYPDTNPPRFAGGTLTIGGSSYKISTMSISLNNEMAPRMDATNVTGMHAYYIVDRNITVTVDPEATLLATKDFWTDWTGETEAALSVVVGSDTGNTITISAPQLQIQDLQPGDRGGLHVNNITFQANRSADAGDDELSIALS